MCYHLVDLSPFLSHPTSSNLFIVLYWVAGEVIVLGVGWQDCQSFAHMPTPPTTFHSLHSTTATHPHGFLFVPHGGLFIHTRIGRSDFCSSGWFAHSHAEEEGLVSSSRTSNDSARSHAARRGTAYQWSFTFFHRVESGMFSPVWWLLIRFWDCCFPMP